MSIGKSTGAFNAPVDNVTTIYRLPERAEPAKKWTPRVGARICIVPSALLAHYSQLQIAPGGRGLNASELSILLQLLDAGADERTPAVTSKRLTSRTGLSVRRVRGIIATLESAGYVKRIGAEEGGPNQYDLSGLFVALDALLMAKVEETGPATVGGGA